MDLFQDRTALCSINQGGDTGPNYISPAAVALSTAVVLVNGLLSMWLKLDMHWQLLIGAFRSRPLPVVHVLGIPLPAEEHVKRFQQK